MNAFADLAARLQGPGLRVLSGNTRLSGDALSGREQRLARAWAALEQTGCSVAEVAHGAGYSSAANFSTAFKRRFGISPKLVRARV